MWSLVALLSCASPSDAPPKDSVTSSPETCAEGSIWSCATTLEHPCDAWWWVEANAYGSEVIAAGDVASTLTGIVRENLPAECLVSCEPTLEGAECEEAICEVDGLSVDYRREWVTTVEMGWYDEEIEVVDEVWSAELTRAAPAEGEWSRVRVDLTLDDETHGTDRDLTLAWEGPIDSGWPESGEATFSDGWQVSSDIDSTWSESWSIDGCAYSAREGEHMSSGDSWALTFPDSTLAVREVPPTGDCRSTFAADLDGRTVEVVEVGWLEIGEDADADGWSEEGGDCDDTDPEVFPCSGCDAVD